MEIVYSKTYKEQRPSMDAKEVEKLEQAIEVHGYRGASKGKHNGVVNLKPTDTNLQKSLSKLKLDADLQCVLKERALTFKIDVKIVAHCPSGNRAIGSLYTDSEGKTILYVLGFCNYNFQLF